MSDAITKRILDLNRVGISLSAIGKEVGLHHTTVKLRLLDRREPAADTRRSFMEDVYNELSPAEQSKLIYLLRDTTSIKEYVRELIRESLVKHP